MKMVEINGQEIRFTNSDDEKLILGYAVWFTISKIRVPWNVVVAITKKVGLNHRFAKPDEIAVFERICSENKEVELKNDSKEKVNVLLRPVKQGLRKVVLERYDKVNGTVEYVDYAELLIVNSRIVVQRRSIEKEEVENLIEDIIRIWETEKDCINEDQIRKVLLNILKRSGKVKLKPSGSVYFVHKKHFKEIMIFGEFLEEIKKSGQGMNSEIWYAPIEDNEKFREMVSLKINETIQEEFERLFEEIFHKIVKNNGLKANEILITRKKAERALKIAQLYSDILGAELEKTQKMLEIALKISQCGSINEVIGVVEREREKTQLNEIIEKLLQSFTAEEQA